MVCERGEVLPTVRQRSKYTDRKVIGKHPGGIHAEMGNSRAFREGGELSPLAPIVQIKPKGRCELRAREGELSDRSGARNMLQ